tara:strand:+ start:899 stop:1675 length:777 start_codon:yes stop_codon:yes gene_type:complete
LKDGPLAHHTVWLTRPAGRAADWQAALEAEGVTVIAEPLIATEAVTLSPALQKQLRAAASADVVIATSVAAIEALADMAPDWSPRGRLLAVGQATADALAGFSGRAVARPDRGDSEGLLAMDALAAPGSVALLAGEGGRTLLADTLAARGAQVERLALYRRGAASLSTARVAAILAACDTLVLTSETAWQVLMARCEARTQTRLAELFLVAASLRVVQITQRDIDWDHAPTLIEPMSATGVCRALGRLPAPGRNHPAT